VPVPKINARWRNKGRLATVRGGGGGWRGIARGGGRGGRRRLFETVSDGQEEER